MRTLKGRIFNLRIYKNYKFVIKLAVLNIIIYFMFLINTYIQLKSCFISSRGRSCWFLQWCLGFLRTSLIGSFPMTISPEFMRPGPPNRCQAQPSCPTQRVHSVHCTCHVVLSLKQEKKSQGQMTVFKKGQLHFGCELGRQSTLPTNWITKMLVDGETLHSFLLTGF